MVALVIAVVAFIVMTTWQRGRQLVTTARHDLEGPLRPFIDDLAQKRHGLTRIPGTAVFLNRGDDTTPLAMRANVEHNHVVHEHVVIVAVETKPVPRVPHSQRVVVDNLGYRDDGILHVTVYAGYMERPDVPTALKMLPEDVTEGGIDLDHASYFLSHLELLPDGQHNMVAWRKRLFVATSLMTADAAGYFNLPPERTVIVGSRMQI